MARDSTTPRDASAAPGERPAASARGRAAQATERGLPGPSGSRRRGALLRRLLAVGDWAALMAALCRRHRGHRRDRRRDAVLGGAGQPGLDPRPQAPRPLRQRPPPDPPQHPRRAAVADLGQRAGDARDRRPAGAEPGRPALGGERDHRRGRRARRQLRLAGDPALPLAPPDRRLDRADDRAAEAADLVARRLSTHPETRLAPGRLPRPGGRAGRRRSCRASARSPTSRRSPASTRSSGSSSPSRG